MWQSYSCNGGVAKLANEIEIKGFIPQKPKDCFECRYFGASGEHLLSGKAHFPSLCEKDLLWLKCKGNEGIKKEENDGKGF